jgi:AraC-like DNA-binding protein
MENLIRQAVELMYRKYGEQLILDEMANAAFMSKFHFIRAFRDLIGVTPCRFLGAIRIQESKRLLRTTSMNVSDVAVRVGYCSTGSFTRHFSNSVECSPIQYRNKMIGCRFAPSQAAETSGYDGGGAISGQLLAATSVTGFRIGVFGTPIAEGRPAALVTADDSGVFTCGPIRPGVWYVHAIGRDPWADASVSGSLAAPMVGRSAALTIRAAGRVDTEIDVHPSGWNDPPMLFAPLDPDPQQTAVELLAS